MQKLTNTQLDKLYTFTQKHYVDYYDLQTELVDHLSNGIEAIWQENNKLSFEDALQLEFKKFGIFGFTDLVDQRRAKMSKRYNKLIASILKTYFTLPRVLLTTLLFLVAILIVQYIPYKSSVVIGLFVIPLSVLFFKMIKYKQQQKKRKKNGQKLWMFEEIISSYGHTFFFFQLLLNVPQFLIRTDRLSNILNSFVGSIIVSVILVVFFLMMYVMLYVIPSKAKEHIAKAHPEYNLV
jgi:hypothetical protein